MTALLYVSYSSGLNESEILDINAVIKDMEKMLRRLIGEDISIETIFAEDLAKIKADKSQLEQIFMNLLLNARDAVYAIKNPEYQRKISIETGKDHLTEDYVKKHPGSIKGDYIFISVSDNGIGINDEIKKKIFEPFFTTKDKFKGTGLGLSTVYGIVKQNSGYISVYSEPDQGTVFKIYWPITSQDEEKVNGSGDKDASNVLSGNESVLIVEDDFAVRQFAYDALATLGYNVSKAANGQLALNLIKAEKCSFDLIVSDIIMPELNGKEFINKAKKILSEVKVIFVSGYADSHVVYNGMLEEDINFIQKPYSAKILGEKVRQVLDES